MARKTTDAQLRAIIKYNEANVKRKILNFNIRTDADILDKVSRLDNFQGYVKRLIREDIKRNGL